MQKYPKNSIKCKGAFIDKEKEGSIMEKIGTVTNKKRGKAVYINQREKLLTERSAAKGRREIMR